MAARRLAALSVGFGLLLIMIRLMSLCCLCRLLNIMQEKAQQGRAAGLPLVRQDRRHYDGVPPCGIGTSDGVMDASGVLARGRAGLSSPFGEEHLNLFVQLSEFDSSRFTVFIASGVELEMFEERLQFGDARL